MKQYFKLLRIKHYLKNILLFAPAFFGMRVWKISIIFQLLLAFLAYSLLASFIYIINDIKDAPKDKLHEVKKHRPIASGVVTIKKAKIVAGGCFIIGGIFHIIAVGRIFSLASGYLLLYVCLNLFYSFGLKNKYIIDIFILASGFVIRLLYGAAVSNIVCSNWLILTVISIALYMGLGKRRNELIKMESGETREVLKSYSLKFLDTKMHMCETIGVVFYSLWSVEGIDKQISNYMVWTIPIVIAIVMKYDLNLEKQTFGDPIEILYNDKILLILLLVYVLVLFIILYFM